MTKGFAQKRREYVELRKRALKAGATKEEFREYVKEDAQHIMDYADEHGWDQEWSDACLEAAENFCLMTKATKSLNDTCEEDYGPSYGQAMQKM